MKLINTGLNRVIKKALFKMEKHSPEILVGLGIVGGITASVLACKATIKAQDILAEAKSNIDAVHEATELDAAQKTDYSEEERRRDLTTAYIQAGLGLAKTYALPVAIGAVSIISIVASHGILKNRVATLVTAYGTLDTAFRNYRKHIQDTFGVDKELEAFHNVKKLKGEKHDENGLALATPKDDKSVKVDGYSVYARCFDEYNPNWKNNAEYNLDFLRGTQRYLQACLERDGYLFLNDVYRELGFEATRAGQIVGWIYDPDRTDNGDNCVSFGLYNPEHGSALGDFINGNSNVVFLDFNVDGVILDRI